MRIVKHLVIGFGLLCLSLCGCGEEFKCSVDYDCVENRVCVDGACQPFQCKESRDCDNPDAVCDKNQCVVPE